MSLAVAYIAGCATPFILLVVLGRVLAICEWIADHLVRVQAHRFRWKPGYEGTRLRISVPRASHRTGLLVETSLPWDRSRGFSLGVGILPLSIEERRRRAAKEAGEPTESDER